MSNHYHLLLETPKGNLVEGMKWLQGTFTQRYNAAHREKGHVYHGRYKAKILDPSPDYFGAVGLYILLNPVDARLVDPVKGELGDYPHSSYAWHLQPPSKRPDWFVASKLLSHFGIGSDSAKGRRAFQAFVQERALNLRLGKQNDQEKQDRRRMERGWVHGSQEFRKAMLDLLADGDVPSKGIADSEQRRDITEHAAADALSRGLSVLGLSGEGLPQLKKGDNDKLLLAGWLRQHFPVSARWCADRLYMGHVASVTRAWHFYQKPEKEWIRKKRKLAGILSL